MEIVSEVVEAVRSGVVQDEEWVQPVGQRSGPVRASWWSWPSPECRQRGGLQSVSDAEVVDQVPFLRKIQLNQVSFEEEGNVS